MIRRSMDVEYFNFLGNHTTIRPWIGGGSEPVDFTTAVLDPANYFFQAFRGGWMLHPLEEGVYELHSMFLPEGRGRPFFEGLTELFRFMFTRTLTTEILTRCPDDNRGAVFAARRAGFRERFRRENAWNPGVGISYQAFTIDDWMMRDPEALRAGIEFHDALEAAKIANGSDLPVHEDDEAHNRAAGAARLMIEAGQTRRGVALYNRWAIFAGYATIEAVGPDAVDIREAIVQVRNGALEVLSLR